MILIYSDAGLEKVELYKEGIDSRYVHTMIRDSKVRVKILKFLMFNTRRLGTGLIIWLAIFTFFKINYIYLIMITVFNIVLISYTGLKLMIVGIPGDDVENGITIDIVEKTIRIVFMVILIINLSAGYCEGSITQWQPAGIFEKGIEILGVSPVLSKYLSTGEITYNDEKLMVIETSKKRIFHFKQPSILEIPRDDKLYNDMIMVQLNTRKDIKGKKYLSQNKIGKIFGISRQMVNAGRVSPYKKAGEKIQSLIKEHKKSVLTPELRERIIELRIENIHLSTKEIKNLLVSGGHVGEDFVEANIRNALKNIDLNKVISKVRKYFTGKKLGINQSYLIKRLFKIIENNAGDIKEVREEIVGIKDSVKSFEKRERKILKDFAKQEKKYRKNYLLAMIFNDPDVVICTQCGSTNVNRKGKKGRVRFYKDEQGKTIQTKSYQYKCSNPNCKKTFTYTKENLMPYARLSKGLCKKLGNLYMGMKGSYNDVVMFTGGKVSKSTVIRLIQRFGGEAISFVDITGVIKWSKVIGVDEKYIKVPKSQKKKSKMRKYMYAYFAVDIYTYNLLHWNVYEYKDFNATKTFLLELKLKGYSHPRVIVTDLMGSYARAIKEVFGKNVIHHYCLFHGMQNVLKIIKKVYGNKDYKKCETAVNLKKLGYKILQSKTKRTADRRYKALFSLKDKAVKANPGIIRLFNFFKRNYPKFINGIESKIVPRTNNTTEFVISRFAQHYRNMRGFDSIDGARCYLNVFAVYYQFTPFTKDARGEIRGQCPLELAGYDISNISYQDCLMSMKLAA